MFVILQACCQIQPTSSSLRYAICSPGHMQCIYSSAYSGVNTQLRVSALPLLIYRQFNVRYTANIVPNTAHILQLTLSDLWFLTYTMKIQFRIFWLQYSNERISAAIGDMSRVQCALYCELYAKYCAHTPDYAICIVFPAIYSTITAPHIQASIFNWTYLSCYWSYVDNSMRLDLQSLCQIPVYAIWSVVPNIYNVITAPHIQDSIFN
jgi:hypothetical protein